MQRRPRYVKRRSVYGRKGDQTGRCSLSLFCSAPRADGEAEAALPVKSSDGDGEDRLSVELLFSMRETARSPRGFDAVPAEDSTASSASTG